MGRLSEYDDLEQSIINGAAKRMSDEIDFQVLAGFLTEIGWTKVILKPMTTEHSYDVDQWIAANIKGGYESMGLVWVFERREEASWFLLKWS